MDTQNTEKKKSKKGLIILLAGLLVLLGGGAFLLSQLFGGTSAAKNPLATALAKEESNTIEITEDVASNQVLYVNGEKTLTGSGKISLSANGEYIIVINSGATLTIDGPTLQGTEFTPNGIYVSENASLILKNGKVTDLTGHGIRVLGKVSMDGGAVENAGTNWLMLDENSEAVVNAGSFSGAGDIGILTGENSKLTLGKDVVLRGAKGNLVYNGGEATITGGTYAECKSYAIHNNGKMVVTGTEFTGAESLGYFENAGGSELTVSGGKMADSKADFLYNLGKADIHDVAFTNCVSSALESKGANASIEIRDCTFEQIGRNVLTNHFSPVTMENITIGDCGGYVVNNSGAEFNGKNITVKSSGATAFLNDSADAMVKDFTLDTFSIGSAKEYGLRNNGGKMTLSNGTVGTTDDYSLYIRDGEVFTDKVTFAGITGKDRAVIQIGQSSTPKGTLTMTDTEVTGGARGISNHGTLIMNSGKIYGNTSKGDLNYGAGVNNTGTMTMNGGTISGNTSKESGAGIYNSGELTVTGSAVIQGNTANNNGGGIGNKGTLIMTGGSVIGNSAVKYGGGVYNTGTAQMSGGNIEKNKAGHVVSEDTTEGGGGGFVNADKATLTGGTIKGNTTPCNGAGVYTMSKGTTTLNGVKVTGNIAGTEKLPTNGGGLYNLGTTTITGKTALVDNISTKNGNGVYNTSSGILNLKGGTVTGAPDKGYAVYVYRGDTGDGKALISGAPAVESLYKSSNGVLTVAGEVSSNIKVYMASYKIGTKVLSESKAGLIAANKSHFVLPEMGSDKILDNNGVISSATDAPVVAEVSGQKYASVQEAINALKGKSGTVKLVADHKISDAIDILADTTITLDLNGHNITMTGDTRVMMIHGNCILKGTGILSGGNAKNGGGVYVNEGATFKMEGGTISGCSTTENGAGIYVTGGSTATITGGTIKNCAATGSGGGIYVANKSTLNITGGTIENCTTEKSAPAIFVYSGVANISGGTVKIPSGLSRNTENGAYNITGGWFATKVGSKYVADGCTATEEMPDAPTTDAPYTVVRNDAPYTIKYVTNSDASLNASKGTYENQIVLPTPTTSDTTVSFAGWYTDSQFSGTVYDAGTKAFFSKSETTLYAKWAVLPDVATYTEGETTTGCKSITSAFAFADDKTGTLTLLEDATITDTLEITAGTDLTLDLNGHNITQTGENRLFMVRGTMTLTGEGILSGGTAKNGGGVYVNAGTFNMAGGTISGCSVTENGGAIFVTGGGKANITDGLITDCSATKSAGAMFVSNGTATISGGTVKVTNGLSRSTANGTIAISGGWFASKVSNNYKASGYVVTDAIADAPDPEAPYTVSLPVTDYTIHYVTNNTTTLEDSKGDIDNQIVLPTPTGETESDIFAGWYTADDFTGTVYQAGDTVFFTEPETTLYAKWGEIPDVATFTEGETTTGYKTFDEAFAATEGKTGTLTLLEDATISDALEILAEADLTLDLNGHNITQTGENRLFMVRGTMTLKGEGVISGGSAKNGGGVYVNGGTFNMEGGTISGCSTTDYGAGIYITGGSTVNISDGTITDCAATGSGGGIYVAGTSTLNMTGGTIENCTTGKSAAAIFVYNGTANISGGTITIAGGLSRNTDNGAFSISGGWFASKVGSKYVAEGYTATEEIADAPNPAAPFTVALPSTDYTVKYVTNNGSTLEDSHGDLENQVVLATPVPADEYSTFLGWYTTADFSGDVYEAGTTAYFTDAETILYAKWNVVPDAASFTEGETTTTYKTFDEAYAATAGKTGTLTLLGDVSVTETMEIAAGTNLTLDLNGHNITMVGSSRLFMVRDTFTLKGDGVLSGGSAQNGGGVYVNENATFTMEGGTISGCSATENGGGVHITTNGTMNMNGGTITDCTAGKNGGGISTSNCKLNISGGTITKCTAASNAGGVYPYKCAMNITGGTFSQCSTTDGKGGFMYVATGSTVNISGGEFSDCTSSSGKVIYNYTGAVNISGGTFLVPSGFYKATNATYSVTGGWFASKVTSSYVASGYGATDVEADAPNASAPYTVKAK